jgi:hypothetical protein
MPEEKQKRLSSGDKTRIRKSLINGQKKLSEKYNIDIEDWNK